MAYGFASGDRSLRSQFPRESQPNGTAMVWGLIIIMGRAHVHEHPSYLGKVGLICSTRQMGPPSNSCPSSRIKAGVEPPRIQM